MIRKIAAVSLAVCFLAMATSGLMMMFIEKPSFTLQMHPVHKTFGFLMVVGAIAHLYFNYRSILAHLKTRGVVIWGGVLAVLLVLLYGLAINNKIPDELAKTLDEAAARAEAEHR